MKIITKLIISTSILSLCITAVGFSNNCKQNLYKENYTCESAYNQINVILVTKEDSVLKLAGDADKGWKRRQNA